MPAEATVVPQVLRYHVRSKSSGGRSRARAIAAKVAPIRLRVAPMRRVCAALVLSMMHSAGTTCDRKGPGMMHHACTYPRKHTACAGKMVHAACARMVHFAQCLCRDRECGANPWTLQPELAQPRVIFLDIAICVPSALAGPTTVRQMASSAASELAS